MITRDQLEAMQGEWAIIETESGARYETVITGVSGAGDKVWLDDGEWFLYRHRIVDAYTVSATSQA